MPQANWAIFVVFLYDSLFNHGSQAYFKRLIIEISWDLLHILSCISRTITNHMYPPISRYHVDLTLGLCACKIGETGNVCKHQVILYCSSCLFCELRLSYRILYQHFFDIFIFRSIPWSILFLFHISMGSYRCVNSNILPHEHLTLSVMDGVEIKKLKVKVPFLPQNQCGCYILRICLSISCPIAVLQQRIGDKT